MPQLARCRPRGRGGGPHDLGCHRRRAHRVPPGQPGRHARVSLRPHRYPRPAPCDAARALPRTGRWSCHRCRGGHGPPLGLPAHPVSALPADGAVLGDARPDRLAQPPATGATLEAPRSPRPAHGPPAEEIAEDMRRGRYLDAREALDYGLLDEISTTR
jgi:Clp protease